jgi:hypothetical protein
MVMTKEILSFICKLLEISVLIKTSKFIAILLLNGEISYQSHMILHLAKP